MCLMPEQEETLRALMKQRLDKQPLMNEGIARVLGIKDMLRGTRTELVHALVDLDGFVDTIHGQEKVANVTRLTAEMALLFVELHGAL